MQQYHVVSYSGGKDSTAMLLRMVELGMKIDEILFCDTGVEFPAMYEHVDRVERYIGREIKRMKPGKSFEYYLFEHHTTRGQHQDDSGYGWARPFRRWCTQLMKLDMLDGIDGLYPEKEIVHYVGIAADEKKRIRDKVYPLVGWGWTEADCLRYCKEKGFDWGGLYDIFHRVSCWCCPLKSLDELRKLRENFPELWQKLQEWDLKTWNDFRQDYSVRQLELRFSIEDEWAADGRDWRGNKQELMREYRMRDRGWEQVKLFG